jgi:hypothetical protein
MDRPMTDEGDRRLLVVEEAFVARGRGVLVMPRFTADAPPREAFDVRLVLPDGSERVTKASVEVSHVRGKLAPFAMYRLPELAPEDVPAGTEIWSVAR